jgi:hypothetical protein
MASDWTDLARRHAPRLRDALARALRPPRRIAWIDRSLSASIDLLIDCRTVRRHLSDAHDGALPRWQARLMRAHLATCAVCAPVEQSLRSTIDLLGALRDPAATLDPGQAGPPARDR